MEVERVKAVFFDAADTLFFVRGGVGNMYFEVAKRYAPHLSPSQIGKAFERAFSSAPPLAFPGESSAARRELEKGWWYDVVRRVFNDAGMFEGFDGFFEELFETFRCGAWELFPDTREVLEELKGRGFVLSVISNFDSRIYDVMDRLGIAGFFDSFFISSEVGCAKPAKEIFIRAVESLSLGARECLHVGDSLENDYWGAKNAGLRALLLDRRGEHGDKGIERVEGLMGVVEFLSGI
jgi:putative hydrolase of the HAD superfamily